MTLTRTLPDRTSLPVMRTPRSVDLEITSQCNLRCGYCYYIPHGTAGYQDRPTGEWLRWGLARQHA